MLFNLFVGFWGFGWYTLCAYMEKTLGLLVLEISPIFVFFGMGQFVSLAEATVWYIGATLFCMGIVWIIIL